ncbi:molecular chaperone TorD [Achromobacter pulmonis]|uniref:molecular chaperone TorD n=1 Tax=Achromobacter pulmonis TaxID=1389932 RepID=UPI001EEEB758|nr:molecular chaperone TorD [Achromobacter pulmonis]
MKRASFDPDWGAACQMRSQLYGWFATVFAREMEPAALALCRDGGADHVLAVFTALGLGRQADAMAAVFKAWGEHADAPLENAADFATLFLLEGRVAPIPYASHYLEGGGQLYGEPARAMRAFLVSSQLQLDAQFKEPEDHLAVILEVLARWSRECGRTDDVAACAADQAAYLDATLMPWVAHWHGLVDAVDTLTFRFYPAVAALLVAFLHLDRDYLRSFGVGD